MMKAAIDLEKGDAVVLDNDEIWIVEDYYNPSGLRTGNILSYYLTMKNLKTGKAAEFSSTPRQQYETADLEKISAVFRYYDGDYYFENLGTGDLVKLTLCVDNSIVSLDDETVYDIYMRNNQIYWVTVSKNIDTIPDNDQNISRRDGNADKPQGIIPDASQAEEWYQKGIEKWNVRNDEAAAEYFMKAAEAGHAEAQNTLGFFYWRGTGVEKDDERSFYWNSKAAEQGNISAQSNLGYSYQHGEGVEKNPEKAFYWYSKAAEQGYKTAQSELGYFYENGEGVEKDIEKAIYWYTKAAEQGEVTAQIRLEELKKEKKR